jgi:hypothetical protein
MPFADTRFYLFAVFWSNLPVLSGAATPANFFAGVAALKSFSIIIFTTHIIPYLSHHSKIP